MTDTKQALLPCPFCGHKTPTFERIGTPRQSCIVACGNCGCRHESGDEGSRSGSSWNERAALSAQPVAGAVARDREADRARFPDPAFNQWLDEGISDAGHTVWDQVGSVVDAWHGWENRKFYPDPQAAPAPEPSDTQAIEELGMHNGAVQLARRLGYTWTNGDWAQPSAQGEPVACDRDAPVCPWCDRQGWDICQHADDARTCGK